MSGDSYPDWEKIRSSSFVSGKTFPRLAEDTPTFFLTPHAISRADLEGADVVIIGAPYAAGWGTQYSGVDKTDWLAAPKRVRQQSVRYRSGYIQDFDLDVLENMRIVDYGDAAIPDRANREGTVDLILEAQAAVEAKVNDALDAGAVPIVIGQNSPCGSYAIAKPLSERTRGAVGMVSLDTHWDALKIDRATMDPRIAGETGKLGCNAFSFICIPPGSAVMYRVVVYTIMYFIAGLSMRKRNASG